MFFSIVFLCVNGRPTAGNYDFVTEGVLLEVWVFTGRSDICSSLPFSSRLFSFPCSARLCLVVLFFPLLASARLFSARLVSSLLCSSRLFSALFFSSLFCSSLLGCIPLRLVRRVEGLRGPER